VLKFILTENKNHRGRPVTRRDKIPAEKPPRKAKASSYRFGRESPSEDHKMGSRLDQGAWFKREGMSPGFFSFPSFFLLRTTNALMSYARGEANSQE
jgi:hypothetical protein